jgi:adenylate cyclase
VTAAIGYGSGIISCSIVGTNSLTVGWMCMVREIAVYGLLAAMMSMMAWMTSSPPTPRIAAPRISSVSASTNLGDGALAVFGAPNDLADHADAAVSAAVLIHRLVAQRFGGELRIGIGINTGVVIAGTIGGGAHLEFTLIGDTTNVAARVEQLTKTTGDAILLTDQTVDALVSRPSGLVDRGAHALKGKSAPARVFGLDPAVTSSHRIG